RQRLPMLEKFAALLRENRARLADTISHDVGKPRWEALTEVDAMVGKIGFSAEAYEERCRPYEREQAGAVSAMRFKPHGVVAIFGPFNFPGHLPNGHIIPALLAGNTVVFKPSEATPLTAELTVKCWEAAGLPPGAINLAQGARQ